MHCGQHLIAENLVELKKRTNARHKMISIVSIKGRLKESFQESRVSGWRSYDQNLESSTFILIKSNGNIDRHWSNYIVPREKEDCQMKGTKSEGGWVEGCSGGSRRAALVNNKFCVTSLPTMVLVGFGPTWARFLGESPE